MADGAVPPRDLERLYSLPLGDFTHARDATARRLRRAGDREAATATAGLRKPTLAAWTVNQLARHERAGVERLLAAASDLHQAMAAGDGRALARTGAAEARALEQLIRHARDMLEDAGERASETTLGRVADTLRAAAAGGEARREALSGTLVRELRATALGPLGEAAAAPARRSGRRAAPRQTAAPARPGTAQRQEAARDRARHTLDERGRLLDDARRAAGEADREAERLRRRAQDAVAAARAAAGRAEQARAAAEEAERSVAEARRRLEEAERALRGDGRS